MLHEKQDHINLLFEKELKSGDLKGLHPECLTDTWIGRDRFSTSLKSSCTSPNLISVINYSVLFLFQVGIHWSDCRTIFLGSIRWWRRCPYWTEFTKCWENYWCSCRYGCYLPCLSKSHISAGCFKPEGLLSGMLYHEFYFLTLYDLIAVVDSQK